MTTATWTKRDGVLVIRPADWPPRCELSFTDQQMMKAWAQGRGVMLKQIKEGRA